jgi:hypothetical protein
MHEIAAAVGSMCPVPVGHAPQKWLHWVSQALHKSDVIVEQIVVLQVHDASCEPLSV